MNSLNRHIESLLLRHNCVIVPNLGGFVAQRFAARYDEAEGCFFPPGRTVAFNPLLTANDGLLAQSFVQSDNICFDEALALIESEVIRVREHLEHEGSYEIQGVGQLALTAEGTYDFIPTSLGIASPSLFGLEALEIVSLAKTSRQSAQQYDGGATYSRNLKTIKMLRSPWMRTASAVAAIAALVLCFVWSAPQLKLQTSPSVAQANLFELLWQEIAEETTQFAGKLTHLVPRATTPQPAPKSLTKRTTALPTKAQPGSAVATQNTPVEPSTLVANQRNTDHVTAPSVAPTTAKPANTTYEQLPTISKETNAKSAEKIVSTDNIATTNNKVASTSSKIATNSNKAATTPNAAIASPNKTAKAADKVTTGYTLVLASQVAQNGADYLVGQLHQAGMSQAAVAQGSHFLRVIYGHYASSAAAQAALKDLRQKHTAFQQAWIMEHSR